MIRLATKEDLSVVMDIMADARQTMRESGNLLQWTDGYPAVSTIESDVADGTGFVVERDGAVVAYFALKPSPDPTYLKIYDGQWLCDDGEYRVIHRVAGKRGCHGIFEEVLAYGFRQTDNIRIDTHRDNTIMQHLLKKQGFAYCGIIHLLNGDERLAYQKKLE